MGFKKLEELKLRIKPDPWQKEFLETKGDKLLCSGRQIGKSVVCGIDAGEFAVNNKDITILMIAPTERQAFALFEKTLDHLIENYNWMIKKGKDRPTKTKIKLKNGTTIWCLPTGLNGLGIRFLTVHRLYVDEASRVPEEVWDAVTPMLATTGGDSIYLSTPFGTEGRYYDVLINKNNAFKSFKRFRMGTEEVYRNRKISDTWTKKQREKALAYIESEKARMSIIAFAQEYLGQPMEDLKRVFPDALLKNCMTLHRRNQILKKRRYVMGQDIAGMGRDTSTWEILDATSKPYHQVENITRKKLRTPQRVRLTLTLTEQYNFSKIGIDDGGMGSGDLGYLLENPLTRRKVISLNNAKRNIDKDGKKSKRLLKEDMYNNLVAMMEQGDIKLLKDEDIWNSLRSIQFEQKGQRIFYHGSDSHIAEGLIRAAWLARGKYIKPFALFI